MSPPPVSPCPLGDDCIGVDEARKILGGGVTILQARFDRGELSGHYKMHRSRRDRHFSRRGCKAFVAGQVDVVPRDNEGSQADQSNTQASSAPAQPPDALGRASDKATIDLLLDLVLKGAETAEDAARSDLVAARSRLTKAETDRTTVETLVRIIRNQDASSEADPALDYGGLLQGDARDPREESGDLENLEDRSERGQ